MRCPLVVRAPGRELFLQATRSAKVVDQFLGAVTGLTLLVLVRIVPNPIFSMKSYVGRNLSVRHSYDKPQKEGSQINCSIRVVTTHDQTLVNVKIHTPLACWHNNVQLNKCKLVRFCN